MAPTPLAPGWEIKFRLACRERTGDQYQELFAQIMERRDPEFQRVRPWGKVGDRKNDGWSPARRMLFQCYAPSSLSVADLVAKMQDDYDGAIAYWEQYFDAWVFVHNDFAGLAPQVAIKIRELDAQTAEVSCSTWGHMELREELACLHDADRTAILGPPLTAQDFTAIDASSLKPLIAALGQMRPDPAAPIAPVPVDKIEANDLHESQIELLKLGSARAPLVEAYLTNAYILPTVPDEIAQAMSKRYQQLRAEAVLPSDIFDRLLAWITGGVTDSPVLANALAILAYFFERCHIFEEPRWVEQ